MRSSVPSIQGVWVGHYLLADITTTVRQKGTKISGKTIVKILFGEKNVYHITGVVHPDGRLEAWHASGHRFVGQLTSEDQGQGILTTKNGTKLKIKGTRVSRKIPSKA